MRLGLLVLTLALMVAACSAREAGAVADGADAAAGVAVWFGPGGVIASAVLIVVGAVARRIEKGMLDTKLQREKESHALTLRKLQHYTAAETMRAFPETDKYAPTESEIIAKVENGHHEFTKPSDAGPRS